MKFDEIRARIIKRVQSNDGERIELNQLEMLIVGRERAMPGEGRRKKITENLILREHDPNMHYQRHYILPQFVRFSHPQSSLAGGCSILLLAAFHFLFSSFASNQSST